MPSTDLASTTTRRPLASGSETGDGGRRGRRPVPGWLAPAVPTVLAVVLLTAWGVAPLDLARYVAYWVAVVAFPGVVAWRTLGPRLRHGVDDLAVGACAG